MAFRGPWKNLKEYDRLFDDVLHDGWLSDTCLTD